MSTGINSGFDELVNKCDFAAATVKQLGPLEPPGADRKIAGRA
jgi:hypothetical protein